MNVVQWWTGHWKKKKKLKAVQKYELNSAACSEGIVRSVMDNVLTKDAKIIEKKNKNKKKFISHCPKNFKWYLIARKKIVRG